MKLFNTATQKLETVPQDHGLTLYTCGPTVYNAPTIGNWRTYIVDDLLVRALRANNLKVTRALNYTDVGHLTSDADTGEDKLQQQAKLEHKKSDQIAAATIAIFETGYRALNLIKPDHVLRATALVPDMIIFIQQLEAKGFVYQTSDGVYFDTSKFATYGQLARLNLAGSKEGARVEKNPEKKNSSDFALWKFSQPNSHRDMEWDSPWGKGFPGWHIECSTMATKLFGHTIDIHTGGIDNLTTHHQNELAQTEALTGQPFVRIWLHIEHLLVEGKRMGKSEGNGLTLTDLTAKGFDPLDLRYLVLLTHYRQKQNFTWEALQAARVARLRMIEKANHTNDDPADKDFIDKLTEIVSEDLDYPQAIAELHLYIKEAKPGLAATIRRADELLFGVINQSKRPKAESTIPEAVLALNKQRDQARADGMYEEADRLRQQIKEAGFEVIDQAQGSIIKQTDAQV
ncbi:MAG: cysteine--tRNA ligase [bacterium]|nr:cysteine--tRNA ligase [bacterium]